MTNPDVGVSDARGPARLVSSIAAEHAKYREAWTGVLGLLVGLLGSFVAALATYRAWSTRKSIEAVARALEEELRSESLTPVNVGMERDQIP
jgi:hypothetical protein